MNFVLRHLSDALVLLKEYKEGCAELAWLIDSHIRRASELVDDLEARRELHSVNVVKSEHLKKVAEIYSKLALKEIEAAGKVSIRCPSEAVPEKQVLMEEDKETLCDRIFPELTGKKEIITDDEVVVTDDESDDSEEEIEFSFERV